MLDETCTRMRLHISAALDGELSDLEGAELSRHLLQCKSCAFVAVDIRRAAELIRVAPAEQPARTISIPRRRSSYPRRVLIAASIAAALALMPAKNGALRQVTPGQPAGQRPYFESVDYEQELIAAARAIRRADSSLVAPA